MSTPGKTALALAAMLAGWAWAGFVTKTLWNWFMVPLFAAPRLDIWWALALGCVVGIFLPHVPPQESDDRAEKIINALGIVFVKPGMYLLFGWVVLQFITPLPR